MPLLRFQLPRRGARWTRDAREVVPRAEIEAQVWQGRVVSYEAVSGAIAKIRKAFGDTDKHHRVIETIPKSGYRLIAEVVRANPSTESIPSPANAVSGVNYGPAGFAAGVVLFVALLGFAVWQVWLDEGSRSASNIGATALTVPDEPSIAVLPFPDMSAEQDQEHFCDGLTEELLNKLVNKDENLRSDSEMIFRKAIYYGGLQVESKRKM